MNIKYTYKKEIKFSELEQSFLTHRSKDYGNVDIEPYSNRSGAIDLVSIMEIYLTVAIGSFSEGFFGKNWFEKLGEKTRKELEIEFITIKNFIKAYHESFIKGNQNTHQSFVIKEQISDISFFVVLNHFEMTEELLDKLPKALVETYGKISLGHIEIESKICQLYPDFKCNEWSFLFTPTFNGFGNFVDRYYDFNLDKSIEISSKDGFKKTFGLNEKDMYKIIINPLIER